MRSFHRLDELLLVVSSDHMRSKVAIVTGSLFVLTYVLFLLSIKGQTVLAEWVQTGILSNGSHWKIRYPYLLDVGFLLLAWIVLWRFTLMIAGIQSKLTQSSRSLYLDIYLIGLFSAFSLVMSYWMIDMGFGIGASGMLAFGLAYLVTSTVLLLYEHRLQL